MAIQTAVRLGEGPKRRLSGLWPFPLFPALSALSLTLLSRAALSCAGLWVRQVAVSSAGTVCVLVCRAPHVLTFSEGCCWEVLQVSCLFHRQEQAQRGSMTPGSMGGTIDACPPCPLASPEFTCCTPAVASSTLTAPHLTRLSELSLLGHGPGEACSAQVGAPEKDLGKVGGQLSSLEPALK